MTQRRAAVVLGLGLALAVGTCVLLLLLGASWVVVGPVTGVVAGLTVRSVLTAPVAEDVP